MDVVFVRSTMILHAGRTFTVSELFTRVSLVLLDFCGVIPEAGFIQVICRRVLTSGNCFAWNIMIISGFSRGGIGDSQY